MRSAALLSISLWPFTRFTPGVSAERTQAGWRVRSDVRLGLDVEAPAGYSLAGAVVTWSLDMYGIHNARVAVNNFEDYVKGKYISIATVTVNTIVVSTTRHVKNCIRNFAPTSINCIAIILTFLLSFLNFVLISTQTL